jgi:hypothetical protein
MRDRGSVHIDGRTLMGSSRWLIGVGLCLAGPAAAQDMWMGGQVGTGLQYVQGVGVGTVLSQVEADFRYATGDWFFRIDLDYHFDPIFFGEGLNDGYQIGPHYPLPPEYAVVQWKPGKFFLRGGVTNPDFGLQEWDEKDNYLPTYTNGWVWANGQNLGIEPGLRFDDGTDLFAFAGYDMAWLTPGFGAGVQTEQDWFGTWSGFFVLPWYGYAAIYAANELYPSDALWLSLEINAGIAAGDPLIGGQFVANLFPDASYGGAVRGEMKFFEEATTDLLGDIDKFAVSASVRADPVGWLHLALEAKESWHRDGDDPYFTGTLYVAVMTPGEPYEDYAAVEEE